jgi:glutamyl-tRNA synthetase
MQEELIRKYTLQNALLYEGKANEKAVLGKIIASNPDLKKDIKEIMPRIKEVVNEVNKLDLDQQKAELEILAPELLEKEDKKREAALIDLEGVKDSVVMRFAPGPSGPLHIGHTRAAILNDEYVKRYGGKLIIRLEDTNPENIDPEAYDSIPEDLIWLRVAFHELAFQSDRFEIYYEHARRLLEIKKAYVCKCDVEKWRDLKLKKTPCPHRELPLEEQLEAWEEMLGGKYNEGEISFVVKTDLEHPNPAVRDFVGMRILEAPHPKTGEKYRVYPLYNFSVALDDHLMEMTHVLRGKDHLNNTLRQKYIYEHFGWNQPFFIHYGLVSIEDVTLKTTVIRKGINSGEYSGWDDVRLATLKALARRGIQPEAIRKFWRDVGTKDVDIRFSWQNLYALNKDLIDSKANRYFFVWSPKRIRINGVSRLEGHAPLHPDFQERGIREVVLEGDNKVDVYLSPDDLDVIKAGDKVRLKDLCNIEMTSNEEAQYIGDDLALIKQGAKIIHWVDESSLPMKVFMPDGKEIEGLVEKSIASEVDNVVQLERFGFARLERSDRGFYAYFGHK